MLSPTAKLWVSDPVVASGIADAIGGGNALLGATFAISGAVIDTPVCSRVTPGASVGGTVGRYWLVTVAMAIAAVITKFWESASPGAFDCGRFRIIS
jgi:hypothetical protein